MRILHIYLNILPWVSAFIRPAHRPQRNMKNCARYWRAQRPVRNFSTLRTGRIPEGLKTHCHIYSFTNSLIRRKRVHQNLHILSKLSWLFFRSANYRLNYSLGVCWVSALCEGWPLYSQSLIAVPVGQASRLCKCLSFPACLKTEKASCHSAGVGWGAQLALWLTKRHP